MVRQLRAAFLAGILVVVPLAVTGWVIVLLVGVLDNAILLVPGRFQPANGALRTALGVGLAFAVVLSVGFLARSYVGGRVVLLYEWLLNKVPVLSSVYEAVKQLLETLMSANEGYFQRVVFVEWPRRGVYSLAFYTGRSRVEHPDGTVYASLFLPTTPNPTTGFWVVIPEDDVIESGLTVEEGFKLLMSGGILQPRRGIPLKHGLRPGDLAEDVEALLDRDAAPPPDTP
jgi:uncharacterized membrane protein